VHGAELKPMRTILPRQQLIYRSRSATQQQEPAFVNSQTAEVEITRFSHFIKTPNAYN
jgi:hypothetical protein